MQALTESFRGFTPRSHYCVLSSVKPNIGHAFFGAGVAGIIKVLLCMRHRQIPPSIHFEKPNPHIRLEETPFFISSQLAPWTVPAGERRRAAVSSFGATGINVHLVIEEFSGNESPPQQHSASDEGYLVPLSARAPEQLREYVRDFRAFVRRCADQTSRDPQLTLENIAYTLQVARSSRAARLAVVVSSLSGLDDILGRFLDGQIEGDGIFWGAQKPAASGIRAASIEGDAITYPAAGELDWREIAAAWASGANIDWEALYEKSGTGVRRRIHLPGYCFAKERHWIETRSAPQYPAAAHPLLQRNSSNAEQRIFSTRFTGEEFFLAQHRVLGNRVLPGVAYLEMVRAAMSASLDGSASGAAICISDVIWVQPYIFTPAANELHIELRPNSTASGRAATFDFQIFSEDGARKVHCQGAVNLSTSAEPGALNLAHILESVQQTNLVARDCYARFASLGFELGAKMQGLREIYRGTDQVLARLELPEAIKSGADPLENAFTLHPALMDSALQACIGFSIVADAGYSFAMDKPALPFVLERMEVFRPCAQCIWVWIRAHEQNEATDRVHRFDLDLCDEAGNVCVRMQRFSSSELKRTLGKTAIPTNAQAAQATHATSSAHETSSQQAPASPAFMLLERAWMASTAGAYREWADAVKHHVLLCNLSEFSAGQLRQQLAGANVSTVHSSQARPGLAFVDLAAATFEWVKHTLLENAGHAPLTLQVIAPSDTEDRLLQGMAGILGTIALEYDRAVARLILVDGRSSPDVLDEANDTSSDLVVRYTNGVRECMKWRELPQPRAATAPPWRDNGVYLITGGVDGIGKRLAAEIAQSARDARIILGGPALPNTDQQAVIAALGTSAARIEWMAFDLCDLAATRKAIEDIVRAHGRLDGVIHCATSRPRTPFAMKTCGEFTRALEPVVLGATHLDEACAEVGLDFFMLCSSSAPAFGYTRQMEDATGCAFFDAFAGHRNELVAQRHRSGRTLSIAWPLVTDEQDTEYSALLRHNTGIAPLDAASTSQMLRATWASRSSQVAVVAGDLKELRGTMRESWLAPHEAQPPQAYPASDHDALRDGIERALIQAVSQVNKLSVADVDVDTDLGDLGFDSISLTTLGDVLNREYGLNLLPTSFFEHPTVAKFTAYLLSEHAQAFRDAWHLHDDVENASQSAGVAAASQAAEPPDVEPSTVAAVPEPVREESRRMPPRVSSNEPIAIVGMSGRFPMARDVAELWENLAAGRDCISEIPVSRWDWRAIHGDARKDPDKTHIKWGGFIDGVDEFDPLFFNIPPRDAEHLDPQHRLLMTYVWSVIEDAGYAPGSLAGSNTAIYVGTAGDMGYGDLVSRATGRDYAPPPVSMAPNRMSYFLDLRGPSEPIETACSSSLVAIHRAVVAIRAGLCDMAIAGGVQTIVTPAKHISFSKSGLLCEDGRCKAFSARANGFVRGEGVGMLMLKRLSDAEAAGDHIYGVILGTAENHGGRATSFTAPNPVAQAKLLQAAYRQSAIDIGNVTYIEAHGTGTELGDPIEINGLKTAFADLMRKSPSAPPAGFCGLGSVKSNIGHLEIAAGVAGVIKVLLQMQHGTLAKSLHTEEINPYIQLQGSPFYIVQERRPWTTGRDSAGRPLPRCAGVSSFGIGGSNAHVVLEEYIPKRSVEEGSRPLPAGAEPALILLSAKTPERLKEAAQNLLAFVLRDDAQHLSIRDIAYTLQVGRDGMDDRLGFMALTLADLAAKLRTYLAHCESGNELPLDIHRGHARQHQKILDELDGEDLGGMVEHWMRRRKFSKLLNLWVNGLSVDWDRLYRGVRPSRVSLPTYSFERERYWVSAESQYVAASGATKLHPLLHRNTSDLSRQKFTSNFCGREFFFADHVVQDIRMLPGVAYLEMARAAVEQSVMNSAAGDQMLCLRNVAWIRPIALAEDQRTVHIALAAADSDADSDGQIQFEIFTEQTDDVSIHCVGVAQIMQREPAPQLALGELLSNKGQRISGAELYERYSAMGIAYGPGHRGVVQVHVSAGEALGELRLPESVRAHSSQYSLHPALLDSALQVSLALSLESSLANAAAGSKLRPVLPFALERLELHSPCTERMWAQVTLAADAAAMLSKVNVDLHDDSGHLCVRMIGLTSRVFSQDQEAAEGLFIATPRWEHAPAFPVSEAKPRRKSWVLLFERDKSVAREVEQRIAGCTCTVIRSERSSSDLFIELATQAFAALQSRLKGDGLLVQWIVPADIEGGTLAALSGLLRTMSLENPQFTGQLILTTAQCDVSALCKRLDADGRRLHERLIRYAGDERQVLAWDELQLPAQTLIPWKNAGIYLITGGMGGLGQVLAREILTQAEGAHVILLGRAAESNVADALCELRSNARGGTLDYRQADVCSQEQVERLVAEIIARHGSLQGILHCAGVLRDSFLIKKSVLQFKEALAPKVAGTLCLDRATQGLNLDFFVLFSSAAAVLGNFGQGDYAVANAFMDEFARARNAQVVAGKRSGHTLSIDWPLWREGGMKISASAQEQAHAQFGLMPLSTQNGLRVLYFGLESRATQLLALSGQPARLRQLLEPRVDAEPIERIEAVPALTIDAEDLEERARAFFIKLVSTTLKIPVQKLRAANPMEQYGIDSIVVMELTNRLETHFGSLSKTLFFEYQTLGELARYFMRAYPEKMRELLQIGRPEPVAQPARPAVSKSSGAEKQFDAALPSSSLSVNTRGRSKARSKLHEPSASIDASAAVDPVVPSAPGPLDIAIVGLSGRYPLARDLNEYWENLRTGRDCLTEVPTSRWDWRTHYDPDKQRSGAHYSKWGGFIAGMDEFDPLFFNISPREAEYMDPQERLFLMHAWQALEDAGYTRASLKAGDVGARVGVYAGVMYVEYQLFGVEQTLQGNPLSLSGSAASVANRVSYIMGLQGPSLTVDTMCSSSLTAIHLACQDLKAGRTSAAIAGGVNLTLHANKYLLLSSGQFISTNGKCESFGAGGDGYIPGEGVGVVVLKRLADAQRAGDHIYGVIKGSAINHGGKTNGYSVPNPLAQQASIADALREAQIDPRHVSYVEAHGTGTKLGDPIEITGLTNAFASQARSDLRSAGQYCWIGSAKSNIGHCEAAAGIAGLTKVLLQLRHGQIAPSLHAEVLNPHIDFAATPFQVNQVLRDWQRPTVTDDSGVGRMQPRIAGISSFGAGGSNAHLVIEEYADAASSGEGDSDSPQLFVLSAKSKEQLLEYARNMHAFLETTDVELRAVCYTLQVGREALSERLALVVHSIDELREKLASFLSAASAVDGLYLGTFNDTGSALAALSDDADLRDTVRSWVEKSKFTRLAEFWVHGSSLDWSLFHAHSTPARVSLPTYPFARERYWIPNERPVGPAATHSRLHPLLHRNTSELLKQRFSSTFSGDEFFLADHVVRDDRVLPAVVYLEMARAGLQKALGLDPLRPVPMVLEHVAWMQPLIVARQQDVHLELHPENFEAAAESAVSFEIYTLGENDERVIHAQGRAALCEAMSSASVDLQPLLDDMTLGRAGAVQCYARLESAGLHYGPRQRGLFELQLGKEQLLASIRLPASVPADSHEYVMHPSLLDSALQACIGLSLTAESGESQAYLPFCVDRVEVHRSCEPQMWAWLRRTANTFHLQKIDMDLCNEAGALCVRILGLASRTLAEPARATSSTDTVRAAPTWLEAPLNTARTANENPSGHEVVLGDLPELLTQALQQRLPRSRCLALRSGSKSWAARYTDHSTHLFEHIKSITNPALLQLVIPNSDYGRILHGLSGLLRSAELETSRITAQVISVDADMEPHALAALLAANADNPQDKQIRYLNGKRSVLCWDELPSTSPSLLVPWRENGVYLITGGLGGLGRIFASEIIERTHGATIILTGRSMPAGGALEQLQSQGSSRSHKVSYVQADVADAQQIDKLVSTIEAEHGALNGVLHIAGVASGGFIINKTTEQFQRALAAKVAGTANLDHATGHLDLDYFVVFSSTTAVTGGIGQADYACANGFMGGFARHRNELVAAGQRSGISLAIDWPLWAEGGMRPEAHIVASMERLLGWRPMSTSTGIQEFYSALASKQAQVLVQAGDAARIRSALASQRLSATSQPQPRSVVPNLAKNIVGDIETVERSATSTVALEEFGVEFLTGVLSRTLRMPASRIDRRTDLEQYGLESKLVLGMTNELEKNFGPLSKTLFFEHRNVAEVSRYFVANHRDRLLSLHRPREAAAPGQEVASGQKSIARAMPARSAAPSAPAPAAPSNDGAIAIIGLSGRYPQAENIEIFWKNLREGRDCIQEIPAERWDWRDYGRGATQEDAPVGKWGGFIAGVDEFDPLFFNISPHEARYLDPQERLFLEHAWIALEDAGYTRESLESQQVGVYAGVMYSEYQLFGVEETARGNPIGFASSLASVANRVSYVLNLHGPSMALDTMCSSSLTALHAACQDLRLGHTRMAIAGGVNVSVHPNKYLALSSGRFLSSQGRCTSFGADGDGYVPGEGVGVVILKRLEDAQRDNDSIYGVIRGSAINHGGKTNGYSVPNPTAQQNVISNALERAGIDPYTVSYIETHGTGTKLGDPIEIAGLSRAFERSGAGNAEGVRSECCWIGSVKSNIGHCEAAAGIAGLTKVLLQMQHGEIVPSLHSSTLNPYIDFAGAPFQVNQVLRPWPPAALTGSQGSDPAHPKAQRRIAGISSFGAGGSNAHLLVEEYVSDAPVVQHSGPCIVPLSARTPEQLATYAQKLLACIDAAQVRGDELNLRDLCFTLQVGREAMIERLALVVHSIAELRDKLAAYLQNPDEVAGLHRGRSSDARSLLDGQDEGMRSAVATWITSANYSKLLDFWVRGLSMDWSRLYPAGSARPQRIRLPTYPFAKERYWIEGKTQISRPQISVPTRETLHPLLHRNTSDFFVQRYSSTFTGREPVFADHVLRLEEGKTVGVLPAAAYLEMARVGIQSALAIPQQNAASAAGLRLTDIVWLRPFSVAADSETLHLQLSSEADGRVSYRFHADRDPSLLYATGTGEIKALQGTVTSDLSELKRAISERRVSAEECYQRLRQAGIEYGPSHRGIAELFQGAGQVLARLELPAEAACEDSLLILHPSLLDAAMQAAIGLTWDAGDPLVAASGTTNRAIPFALDELNLFEPCTEFMWAWVRRTRVSGLMKLDIDLLNENGALCVQLKGLTSRAPELTREAQQNVRITAPRWVELRDAQIAASVSEPATPAKRWIVLCERPDIDPRELQNKLGEAVCLPLRSDQPTPHARFTAYAAELMELLQFLFTLQNEDGTVRDHLQLQLVVPEGEEHDEFLALVGMLRSARLENARFRGQVVQIRSLSCPDLAAALDASWRHQESDLIRWEGAKALARSWVPIALDTQAVPSWKHGGVYLITGGLGGLGRLFCEAIVRTADDVTLILCGRSELDAEKQQQLAELKKLGRAKSLVYRRVDIGDASAVTMLIRGIVEEFGALNGILHGAGTRSDSLLVKKSESQLRAVFAPKVAGASHLSEASQHLTLDFFVLFSSAAALWGGVGQGDYAAANAFLDEFAHQRNQAVAAGHCWGRTLSINWPYWKDGGMRMDTQYEALMRDEAGLAALDTDAGLQSFYRALASGEAQVLVEAGETERIERYRAALASDAPRVPAIAVASASSSSATPDDPGAVATGILKQILASILNLPAQRIREDEPLETYGMNSVMAMDITKRLEAIFGTLSKTLLYEYQTIQELARHFVKYHSAALQRDQSPQVSESQRSPIRTRLATPPTRQFSEMPSSPRSGPQDIAIVGMSGRYPQADDLKAFWQVLRTGTDCITEIPPERWDAGNDTHGAQRWGGFISGVEEFDPLFFRISPRDADHMDPQERLFLQHAWLALEDAGYTRAALQERANGRVGVYAGVMYSEYHLLALETGTAENPVAASASHASVANRVSYALNLSGPSMTVDTMCSSSLTCVHLACQDLKLGRTQLAIAGGVNVNVHPNKFSVLGASGFLSSSGRCESFGDHGDGYVPSEGVGVVVLKRLQDAVRDGDEIYGVIKGSALNHGGKTNGYTVPNPNAQQSVIEEAIREAGIDASAITYVEAHGTGTRLGDPIEITALSKAFTGTALGVSAEPVLDGQDEPAVCWLGAVKSNIGHGESSAGIAALTKVLLQMKHAQIAPSLHSQTLNSNIDFSATPFQVNQTLRSWPRPYRTKQGRRTELPRIAGVSSFGAGGSNAHFIVEEYSVAKPRRVMPGPFLIPVSAQDDERLKEYAQRLRDHLEDERPDLADVAYTFQTGREPMPARLALIAHSVDELSDKLRRFVAGEGHGKGLFHGRAQRGAVAEGVAALVANREYARLLEAWIVGTDVDWDKFYTDDNRPSRIHLPVYPFARHRHWIPGAKRRGQPNDAAVAPSPATPQSTTTRPVVMNQSWIEYGPRTPEASSGAIIVLHSSGTRELARALFNTNIAIQVLPIAHDPTEGSGTDFYSAESGLRAAKNISQAASDRRLIGLIDLTACDTDYERTTDLEAGKIRLLQWAIEHLRHAGLNLLQVTHLRIPFKARQPTLSGARMSGLYRMLSAEYPTVRSATMDSDAGVERVADLAAQIEAEFLIEAGARYSESCYRDGRRYEAQLVESAAQSGTLRLNVNDVVLVTGGTRGIGRVIVEHAVARGARRLVVLGREQLPELSSDVSSEKAAFLRRLMQSGVRVLYFNPSLSDRSAMERVVRSVHDTLGPITNVFHCAGVSGQSPAFYKKPLQEWSQVYEPKVPGLVVLHEALRDEPLERFVLFSSVASAMPRLASGQSDYAAANGFMDSFAACHAAYMKSVQWPAWAEVGMAAGLPPSAAYREARLIPLKTSEALALLESVLSAPHTVSLPAVVVDNATQRVSNSTVPGQPLASATRWLRTLFMSELRLKPEQVDDEKTLEEYGVESIVVAQLARTMGEKVAAPLDPSVLFEHRTIQALAIYLSKKYPTVFADGAVPAVSEAAIARPPSEWRAVSFELNEPIDRAQSRPDDIAVVGMACRLPGASNHEEFWQLLNGGVSAISRGPTSRAPQERWRGTELHPGGWLDDIDRFDPGFFNIPEDDARIMDPQMRLLLEESLRAIYDAGYDHRQLAGKKVGVYIGARSQSTADAEAIANTTNPVMGLAPNYIATSISRFFDFHGPSTIVDTACSSALSGLSFAADALAMGRIEMALVGAVSLLLSPGAHEMFKARGILSPSGAVRIFDRRADGDVLGEGGGFVMVKRLRDAIRDGNRIYAVVKAIALNNDGRTLGPGSPSIQAQRELLREAVVRSGRSVEDIGYIEVSGSGSPVVDSVELRALTDCYRLGERSLGPCHLGSVKPNIGHLLLGSGLAGFLRCVLSVHHKAIPPFLSALEPFDYYDFNASRIVFDRASTSWILDESANGRATRVAALSSFADGGTNAHVVIEEFVPPAGYEQTFQPRPVPLLNRMTMSAADIEVTDVEHEPAALESESDGGELAEILSRFTRPLAGSPPAEQVERFW